MNGQKGVIDIIPPLDLPTYSLDNGITWQSPDVLMHPDSILRRQTFGQILEDPERKMANIRYDNQNILSEKVLVCKANFTIINYRSADHVYVAKDCIYDSIHGQPTRGTTRNGGMKLGKMEIFNCILPNGLSGFAEEKFCEHSDRVYHSGCHMAKACFICREDCKTYKCTIVPAKRPCISFTKYA
jgi:DNA-directed RNA polymerase beta subunit